MNKRAQHSVWAIDSMPSYIIFILFVTFSATLFVVFAQYYSADQYVLADEIKEEIVSERFITTCFTTNAGIIAWENFKKETINECYNVDESSKESAYQLTLSVNGDTQTIRTANWKNKPADQIATQNIQIMKEGIIAEG